MVLFYQTCFDNAVHRREIAWILVSPELDNLSCHAELSAIRIITMPITTKVIRYGVISPSGSSGGRSYPFECLFGFALSARVRHHRNRMPKTTSRDLVLMAAHYSGPCEPGNAARI